MLGLIRPDHEAFGTIKTKIITREKGTWIQLTVHASEGTAVSKVKI